MRTQTPKRFRFRRRPVVDEPLFSILIFTATVMGTLTALGLLLPRPVILPAFSLCALAAAAGIALMAYMCARLGGSPWSSAWNLVGAFTLVGCAAAIFGEVEAIVEYTRHAPPRSKADD